MKITENLGFKSLLRKVKLFFCPSSFHFKILHTKLCIFVVNHFLIFRNQIVTKPDFPSTYYRTAVLCLVYMILFLFIFKFSIQNCAPSLKSLNLINYRNSNVWEGPVSSVIRTFGMLMGEFNDGTDVDKWLYDNIKEIGGSNFSVQVILYQTISIFCQLFQNNRDYFTDISFSKA